MSTVTVSPYDPAWPRAFEAIRARVWPVVQHAAMAMEHVGSTAVPGLSAKPVIDACIIVASPPDIPFVVKALVSLGYEHRGDLGVPGRDAFRAPRDMAKHHLYASPRKSLSLRNHLGLRDYLRATPDAALAYGQLKVDLAARHPHDIDAYIAGKSAFILDILRTVGLSDDELESIRTINLPAALARTVVEES